MTELDFTVLAGGPAISAEAVRAVLWDADGVLQQTPARPWELAGQVVAQLPGAMTGAPIDEERIRVVASGLGLGDRLDDILAVWSTFDLLSPSLEVVALVRAAGTVCYLATNQNTYRASYMREKTPYNEVLDGAYYSCDIGTAKPSTAFFEHIVNDLDLTAGQLLFIDDQPRNVAGARSAGLEAECWTHNDGLSRLRDILHAHGIGLNERGGAAHRRYSPPTGGSAAAQAETTTEPTLDGTR